MSDAEAVKQAKETVKLDDSIVYVPKKKFRSSNKAFQGYSNQPWKKFQNQSYQNQSNNYQNYNNNYNSNYNNKKGKKWNQNQNKEKGRERGTQKNSSNQKD